MPASPLKPRKQQYANLTAAYAYEVDRWFFLLSWALKLIRQRNSLWIRIIRLTIDNVAEPAPTFAWSGYINFAIELVNYYIFYVLTSR